MDRRTRPRQLGSAHEAASPTHPSASPSPPQHRRTEQMSDCVPAQLPNTCEMFQQLPEALLTQIVLAGGTHRHLHGAVAAVCQEWRRVLLQNTKHLSVGLTSTNGAASLAEWLSHHAAMLEQLSMETVGLFGRNCGNDTRLQLFEALHNAAGQGHITSSPSQSAEAHSDCDPQHVTCAGSSSSMTGASESFGSSIEVSSIKVSTSSDISSDMFDSDSDSSAPDPYFGGLFAGSAHLSTPSPSGELLGGATTDAQARNLPCPSRFHPGRMNATHVTADSQQLHEPQPGPHARDVGCHQLLGGLDLQRLPPPAFAQEQQQQQSSPGQQRALNGTLALAEQHQQQMPHHSSTQQQQQPPSEQPQQEQGAHNKQLLPLQQSSVGQQQQKAEEMEENEQEQDKRQQHGEQLLPTQQFLGQQQQQQARENEDEEGYGQQLLPSQLLTGQQQHEQQQQQQQHQERQLHAMKLPPQQPADQQQHSTHMQPQLHLQLRQLSVKMRLTPADCWAIATLPAPQLRDLCLLGSRTRRLGIDGVKALATLTRLTSLQLQQFNIGDDAAALLAEGLDNLQVLCLQGNNIGPLGAAAIAGWCTKLEQLDLSTNRIDAAAVSVLATGLQQLRSLNIAGNSQLDAPSLKLLSHFPCLTNLNVSSCSLKNVDLHALCSVLPQLQILDVSNNRLSKLDALLVLPSLTSLNLNRNPLQINSSKVLAMLPLKCLSLFDAAQARGIAQLAGVTLAGNLTALTLGSDPSTNVEDSSHNGQLAKTRTCSTLFGTLAVGGCLQLLNIPCTGLGDLQAKLLGKLGASLRAVNLSYNCVGAQGLKVMRELTQLKRLELRSMRPELNDEAVVTITSCTTCLTHLDLAHNDVTSVGVKQLGCPALSHLRHLDLRNNAQIDKWSILLAAPHLSGLTHINLMEISDVRARAFPRPTKPGCKSPSGSLGPAAAAAGLQLSPGTSGVNPAAAAAAAAFMPVLAATAAAPGRANRCQASNATGSGGVRRPHADLWAAFPELEYLVVEADSANATRRQQFWMSCV